MILYIACPYTHPNATVRFHRKEAATSCAAVLASAGYVVFSPITQGHQLFDYLPPALSQSHEFWMSQCLPMLDRADALFLLPFKGWRESRGVREELRVCAASGAPVYVCDSLPLHFPPFPELVPDIPSEEEILANNWLPQSQLPA